MQKTKNRAKCSECPKTSPSFWKQNQIWTLTLAGILLVMHYTLAVSAVRTKSSTFDESVHLTEGYFLWKLPEHKHIASNGITAQMLGAASLLFQNLATLPASKANLDSWWRARIFIYESGNPAHNMFNSARALCALLGLALGCVIFYWSRDLFGDSAALFSLALFAFNPLFLANTPLVTADMAATFGLTTAAYCFWQSLHRATTWHIAASSVATAFALMSKMSAILLAPIFGLMILIRIISGKHFQSFFGNRTPPKSLKGIALSSIGVASIEFVLVILLIWIFYNFNYANTERIAALGAEGIRNQVFTLVHRLMIFPPAYMEGLACMLEGTDKAQSFLNGRYSNEGWWWFFPYGFLVKTPIATLIIIAAAPFAWFKYARSSKARLSQNHLKHPSFYELTPLIIFMAVYGVAAINTSMNIGVRHILPIYPPLFILAGANASWLESNLKSAKCIILGLLAMSIFSGLWIWPHYLAYFNSFAGGPSNAYRHLVDSSLDWGQDLPGLNTWLKINKRTLDRVYLSYFGTAQPEYFGIEAQPLPRQHDWGPQTIFPLEGGIYCISATMLQSVYSPFPGPWCIPYENLYTEISQEISAIDSAAKHSGSLDRYIEARGRNNVERILAVFRQLRFARLCAFLRSRKPEANVGYSILIYRLTDQEVQMALTGPPSELLPRQQTFERNSKLIQ